MSNQDESDDDAPNGRVERWRQEWLLPRPRPLTDRLGRDFFLQLPKAPGVYLMHGQGGRPRRERVLYVGKSRNLRQRLDSYRHVNPERDSRRIIRLVHSVERITFEECADETSALLRENALLRQHRPMFNRANVRPEAHGYIGLHAQTGRLTIAMSHVADDSLEWHGAFKGGRRYAMASLLRLLVQRSGGHEHLHQLPRLICRDTAPRMYGIGMSNALQVKRSLTSYLRGRSWKIVDQLGVWMTGNPAKELFLQHWREQDLETIRSFYLNGPRRNLRWRRKLGMTDNDVLRPEDLDDLPIKIQLAAEKVPWEPPSMPVS